MNLCITLLVSQGQFARTFGGTSVDEPRSPYSIVQTSDGGFAVAGYTDSFGAGAADFLVLKLAPDGSLSWARTYGGTLSDEAFSIIQTTDRGYAVMGPTNSFANTAFLVLKLSSNGSLSWARGCGVCWYDYDYATSIIQTTTDGGFAVTGMTTRFGAGAADFFVLKLTSSGSLSWVKAYGGTYADLAWSIIQTSDGGFAVAGETESFGAGAADFLVLKLAPDGSLSWARTFGDYHWDQAYSIVQTMDGGFAVAGETASFGASNGDFLVLRLDAIGNYPECVQACSPTVTTRSMPIGSLSLTTRSPSPSTFSPPITELTPSLTIRDVCEPLYEDISDDMGQPEVTIAYSPVSGGVLFISAKDMGIKIYSSDGRLAYSGELEKGENRINLETGVYLWQAGSYKGKAVVR